MFHCVTEIQHLRSHILPFKVVSWAIVHMSNIFMNVCVYNDRILKYHLKKSLQPSCLDGNDYFCFLINPQAIWYASNKIYGSTIIC